MITVQVWDRSKVNAVERAIRESDLGLNPSIDGQMLRLPIPELNEERRQEIAKVAHKYAEQARIAVRNVRRDGMEHLKRAEKDGDMSKDEHHSLVHQGAGLDRQDHQGDRRGPGEQGSRDHAGLDGRGGHITRWPRNGAAERDPCDGQARLGTPAENPTACHVAIIMDGNGRWAAERGLPRTEGHRQGVEAVQAHRRGRARARHHASDVVQLLLGELVAAEAGDQRPVRDASSLHSPRPGRPAQ